MKIEKAGHKDRKRTRPGVRGGGGTDHGSSSGNQQELQVTWLPVPESVFPEITLNYQYLQSLLNS